MNSPAVKAQGGFTLVEILVVTVIMGLAITSIYSLYLSTQKSSVTSEEVVDVQQNLRVAMETMVQDIRMAGFLVSSTNNPVATAPGIFGVDEDADGALDSGASFQLNTSTSTKTIARVTSVANGSPPAVELSVEDDMAANFVVGNTIDVIRPENKAEVLSAYWAVTGVDTVNDKITVSDGSYVAGSVEAGDMIVRKLIGEAQPTVVSYWLRHHEGGGTNNYDLIRDDGSADGPAIVASNISSVSLNYLAADGTAATSNANIAAVRINMSAQTDNNKQAITGLKTRSLQTLVKIRNASS